MRKHPLAHCEDCPFQNDPFVPTQNLDPSSKLAVVGQAPGAYEARDGIPFTGPSGKLLNQVLAHHGFQRESVMVTNICLCRPEDKEDPPKAAIAACLPRLQAELETSGVRQILAVGGTSASTLIDPKKKISSLRIGPPKPYILDPDVSVIASWHPAYCLRAPDSFPSFVSDVGKLRGNKTSQWKWGTYKVSDDVDTTLEVIKRLWSVPGPLVIDIETGFDKDEVFEHPDHYEFLCIGISYAIDKVVVLGTSVFSSTEVCKKLGELLSNKKVVGHNIKSDIAGMIPLFGLIRASGDTMLQSYAQDERTGLHGLEKLGIEHLGTSNWKEEFRRLLPAGNVNFADAPRQALYAYNAKDVMVTRALYELFNSRMSEREHKLHTFLVDASNAVVFLERAGIAFDLDYNKELGDEFESDLFNLELTISNTTGRNLNPRSPMQILRWFSEQGRILPNTQADLLEAMLPTLDGKQKLFVEQLLKHRRMAKLFGTYVKGYRKRIYKGKVYTTYSLHGTTSGRLASKNPNLQNVVRDKRIKHQFMVEHPDNVFVALDYKQNEGRVIATEARDEYLATIFRDPERDIFNELCNDIFGIGNWTKENRVSMKSIFYGNAYGRGVEAIAFELQQQGSLITVNETRELMRKFNLRIPNVVRWQNHIKYMVNDGQDLITPFGRKRSFWLITPQNRGEVEREALSFMPQSIASDICLTALINILPKLEGLATMRLTVHDSLMAETHEKNKDEVISIMQTEMVTAGKLYTDYVPFVVDVSVGKRWSEL